MATNFDKILKEKIDECSVELTTALSKKSEELKDIFLEKKGYKKLDEEEKKINKKIEELRQELKSIELKKDKINNYVYDAEKPDDFVKTPAVGHRRIRLADVVINKKLIKSKAYMNYMGMDVIRKKFTGMMELAIGAKEKRSVLGEFYKLNWTELGIKIPASDLIGDITIEGGRIITTTKQLKTGK